MSTACLPASPESTRVKSRDGPLNAARYRNYHPTLGRWIERDPAGYVDGPNLYAYVSGNPAVSVDPTGLCGETAPQPLGLWRGGGSIELLPYLPEMGEPRVELLPFIPLNPRSGIWLLVDPGFSKENRDFYDRLFPGSKSTTGGDNSSAKPDVPAGPSLWDRMIGPAGRLIDRIIAALGGLFWSPTPKDIEENPDMVGKGMVAGAPEFLLTPKMKKDMEAEGGFEKMRQGNNTAQNAKVRHVAKKLGLNEDQADQLHRVISGEGYSTEEIRRIAQSMFPKGGKK